MKPSFMNGEVVLGSIILILAIVYGAMSFGFPEGYKEPGASFMPIIISIGLVISSMFIIISGCKRQKCIQEQNQLFKVHKKQWLLLLSLFGYLLIMPYTGFIIGTLIFIFLAGKLFGFTGMLQPAIFSIISTLVIYCIFYMLLEVPLNLIQHWRKLYD